MSKYKYIIFDLDGTLSDSKEGITKSVQYALEKVGIIEENLDNLNHFVGPPMVEEYMKTYGMSKEKAFETLDYYRERYVPTGIYETKLYPGIKEILEAVKQKGLKIGMATSKPEGMAKDVAKYLEIFDYFDIICGADLHGPIQSKASVLNKLFETSTFTKEESVLIGDTKFDVEGADEIGIDCLGVTWGTGTREEILESGAIEVFDDYQSLIDYLLGE
ncbi:MAG: HAD hydrolase-like protein [Eubacterium sp.]|nr:HAD hydrolase-like protein [Eubacterium sp.]